MGVLERDPRCIALDRARKGIPQFSRAPRVSRAEHRGSAIYPCVPGLSGQTLETGPRLAAGKNAGRTYSLAEPRALSSVGEHFPYKEGVAGSSPAAPTGVCPGHRPHASRPTGHPRPPGRLQAVWRSVRLFDGICQALFLGGKEVAVAHRHGRRRGSRTTP